MEEACHRKTRPVRKDFDTSSLFVFIHGIAVMSLSGSRSPMSYRHPAPTFAEFFAGGGMVRAALAGRWDCVLANDIDPEKCRSYRANWGGADLVEGDVKSLDPKLLLQDIDLYWASSPCQDFSLAGKGAGLAGKKSGVFEDWMGLVKTAVENGFGPKIICFENVMGLVSRNDGADFNKVLMSFIQQGYRIGALEISADRFLPQSRPRIFVIAIRNDVYLEPRLTIQNPVLPFHSKRLQLFVAQASETVLKNWVWWRLSVPTAARKLLSELVQPGKADAWFAEAEVRHLLSMMSDVNAAKVKKLQATPGSHVATVYKRGRPDAAGLVRQRAEVRFDGVSGCLRTPAGGSSRQTVLFVSDGHLRARLLSVREAARLMGLSDQYILPASYNAGYRLAGDGVAVPVVDHIATQILEPIVTRYQNAKVA